VKASTPLKLRKRLAGRASGHDKGTCLAEKISWREQKLTGFLFLWVTRVTLLSGDNNFSLYFLIILERCKIEKTI